MQSWSIGRSGECDVVIHHAHISGVHAAFEIRDDGTQWIVDRGSTNGVFLNSLAHRISEAEVDDDDLVYFSRHYSLSVSAIKRAMSGPVQCSGISCQQTLIRGGPEKIIRIGRADDNDVVIPRLDVSRHHAEIRQLAGGQLQLCDLGSKGGTYVNDRQVSGETVDLTPEQKVEIGGLLVSISLAGDSTAGTGAEVVARVGVEREGIYLHARGITLEVRDRQSGQSKRLLHDFDTAVYRGEFVGILGPSGCGKTTLLDLLSGNRQPSGGEVFYNGLDLHQHLARFAPRSGYVPQRDLLHPELTARETLYYSARLKLPSEVSDAEIFAKVDRVCEELGLYKPGGGMDARDVPVGSAERKGLSGGQRKRVSLAIELLTDPQILFLDEPTSGLSSHDTRTVMEGLRRLASELGIAIFITIHQPSLRVYRLMDKVIYLKNGRLCYFGPAFPDSIRFFETEEDPATFGPDGVMERLDEADEKTVEQQFRGAPEYDTFVQPENHFAQPCLAGHSTSAGSSGRRAALPGFLR